MARLQVPELDATQALTWYYEDRPAGTMLGHDGEEQGIASLAMLRPADGKGALVLVNGDWNESGAIDRVFDRLMEVADAL
jgi:hypothetical protein